ncbi:MAG: LON peptidase substrate-binding domain-containing protein [Anaerolineae bacterium]|nr:LON peptidase substrate-binding domain-containing protein [Anaerolineae bacterium]
MSETSKKRRLNGERITYTLPLFPLRLVMFPGQMLPLHVFEPRYRLMVNHCIAEREPFGIVLMRDDIPDWRGFRGQVDLPHTVGTSVYIHQVERLGDGRLNIVTVGLNRFMIRELLFDMPYLQAVVEEFPLQEAESEEIVANAANLRRLLNDYVHRLSEVIDAEIDADDMPDEPEELAFLTASTLQIPWDDKQSLLATPDLSNLVDSELELLGRETMLLGFMHSTEARLDEQVFGVTGMLYPN